MTARFFDLEGVSAQIVRLSGWGALVCGSSRALGVLSCPQWCVPPSSLTELSYQAEYNSGLHSIGPLTNPAKLVRLPTG